jgi:hypothetical protein
MLAALPTLRLKKEEWTKEFVPGQLVHSSTDRFTRQHQTESQINSYSRRGIILSEANPMSGVFKNIDPPPLSARRECPRLWYGGRTHSLGGEGVGVNFCKTPDTVLYSTYVRTLWLYLKLKSRRLRRYERPPTRRTYNKFIGF